MGGLVRATRKGTLDLKPGPGWGGEFDRCATVLVEAQQVAGWVWDIVQLGEIAERPTMGNKPCQPRDCSSLTSRSMYSPSSVGTPLGRGMSARAAWFVTGLGAGGTRARVVSWMWGRTGQEWIGGVAHDGDGVASEQWEERVLGLRCYLGHCCSHRLIRPNCSHDCGTTQSWGHTCRLNTPRGWTGMGS
jgi:hypothetical protein